MAELASVVERAVRVCRLARSKREYVEEFGSGNFQLGDRAGTDATLDRALSSLWVAYQPIVTSTARNVYALRSVDAH
jgi:hypothetical protein